MKHQFAIFYPELSDIPSNAHFLIDDKELIHRLVHILRVQVNDSLIFFNQTKHALISIDSIDKKKIDAVIQTINNNISYKPIIKVLLPILKKDDLVEAVYSLCEIGVTTIQLIHTKKTRKWVGTKELERLQRVIISAAEQSKNYAFPSIYEPIELEIVLKDLKEAFCIVADPYGDHALDVINEWHSIIAKECVLTVGPEGAFVDQELALLKSHSFHSMKLTPTILRARQAITLLSGIIRSL
jgi:RsmE family RNA methyltransferase